MATDTSSMSDLVEKLSKTEDPKKILELSREINESSANTQVSVAESGAERYPFTFHKGDMVVRKSGNSIDPESLGEIVDGVYEGTIRPGGAYTLIYTVKRIKDGLTYDASDLNLVRPQRITREERKPLIQFLLDQIEPGWIVIKPQSPGDIDDLCIFQKPAERKEARAGLPVKWFDDGDVVRIRLEIQSALNEATVK